MPLDDSEQEKSPNIGAVSVSEEQGRLEIRRLLRPLDPDETGSLRSARFNTDALLSEFQNYSRQPFVEVLSVLISAIPTPKAIQEFAEDHPDRWANAVRTMAALSGYHDKLEISGNIAVDIQTMGDAQLLAEIENISQKLDKLKKSDPLINQGVTDVEFEEDD